MLYMLTGLILGEQENCELSDEVSKVYPHCRGKVAVSKIKLVSQKNVIIES